VLFLWQVVVILLLVLSFWLWLYSPFVVGIREHCRQRRLEQEAKELEQQARCLTENLQALLKKGAVEEALARYDAQRFNWRIASLLPQSLHRVLREEKARRLLNPNLWMLLTRRMDETATTGLIESGEINEASPEDNLQVAATDPPSRAWEMFAFHVNDPEVIVRWQAFVHACCLLVPDLPEEAREWIAKADEYQMGRLSFEEFDAALNRADDFYEARKAIKSLSELGGLTVALYCFAIDGSHFSEGARSFLEDLESAGVSQSRWRPLLKAYFPEILRKVGEA
jgi:hypothetical protein